MQETDDFFWIKESAEFVKIKSFANKITTFHELNRIDRTFFKNFAAQIILYKIVYSNNIFTVTLLKIQRIRANYIG